MNREEARIHLIRAAMALINHEESQTSKVQDSEDPGIHWMNEHGIIMNEVLRWASVALTDLPAEDIFKSIEGLLRSIQHPGQPTRHLDSVVVEHFFGDWFP